MRRIFFFFLPCLFLMLSARVHAGGFADSPWPMCGRDPGHSSCSVTGLPTTNVLKWKFQGDGNLGSPVIGVDGTLYFGSNDGNPYDSTNCGYLYAVNPDGSLRWKSFSGRSTYSPIPAIGEDGTIYIGSQDSCLYAFNPDGTLKWKYLTSGAIDSSPVIGYSGYIYINSYDCNLYALNSNGDLQWKFMYYSINDCPAVGKDGTVYISRNRNCLYALNPDGSIKWQYGPITYTFESPSICDDESTIYVGASNKLFAINMDGSLKWVCSLPLKATIQIASPSIDKDGTVYIGSIDFSLHAVNPDGTLKWSFPTNSHIHTAATIGSDGTIYIQNYKNLYAITPDGALRWSYPVESDGPVCIGSDGTMYFTSKRFLCALAPEKPVQVESGPEAFSLEAPRPNPFNPSTSISFTLPEAAAASLTIHDALGQKVATLVNGSLSVGTHSVTFNGAKYASGVYFYRFESAGTIRTGKMLLLK